MNNKPRYAEGTIRNKLVKILHASIVITPRSYKLLNEPLSSISNIMVKMKQEGVIEKNNNTEIFENFVLKNYRQNCEKYFYDNIPKSDILYFAEYGEQDLKNAR